MSAAPRLAQSVSPGSRVIERHQRRLDGRARRITIDLDPTDDATHGAQQLTFFNGHYDSWCYLPLLAFLTFDQEREQYLCAAVLRPGNVPATRGTVGVLGVPLRTHVDATGTWWRYAVHTPIRQGPPLVPDFRLRH